MNISPGYRECLKIAEDINRNAIPELNQLFKTFIKDVENDTLDRENLNTCRMYTLAAKESLNSGKIDNSKVRTDLSRLDALNKTLSYRSDSLGDLCNEINQRYVRERKRIESDNLQYLGNIKESSIPAEELKESLTTLHKKINKLAHDGINEYIDEIESNIKETESKIVDDVMFHYRNIIKQDPETFGRMTRVEWTKTEFWGVFRSGAFERSDYTLGV